MIAFRFQHPGRDKWDDVKFINSQHGKGAIPFLSARFCGEEKILGIGVGVEKMKSVWAVHSVLQTLGFPIFYYRRLEGQIPVYGIFIGQNYNNLPESDRDVRMCSLIMGLL